MTYNLNTMAAALGLAMSFACLSATAQEPPKRLRGTIESVDGATLKIKPASGDPIMLHVSEGAKVTSAVPASLADVKPGSYVGIANEVEPDGSQVAVEVHIFPEAARGTGDGQRAWDLSKSSKMTNGAVGTKVTSADGDKLEITYKGGSSTIHVKPGTQVMSFVPGTLGDLKPGTHIVVRDAKAGPNGTMQASSFIAGKDGFAPAL